MSVQSCIQRKQISFLPLGRTGGGKSSLMNLLAGKAIFETNGSGKSCTKNISKDIVEQDDLILIPIDAPGFCDSDGDEQKNMNALTNFLKKLEHGLNAIAIVICYSDHRLDTNLQKSIKYLYNFFGNGNFWFHVCFVVTHCPPYEEDIINAKKSMTTGEESLKSVTLQMIRDVCNLDKDPEIPFFFFDSKHPNDSPTKESLPIFLEWLKSCEPFDTKNLEIKDVEWQYQEKRNETKTRAGPMKPIFELLPGDPKMITIEEDDPYVEKELRDHEVNREVEEWVDRKWDGLDICTIGIARLFRDNKVKRIVMKKFIESYEEDVVKYRKKSKQIFSGEYGKMQKNLKGYYQEVISIVESYVACWSYNCKSEDIKNKINPVKTNSKTSQPEITIHFFDKNGRKLDPKSKLNDIEELKALIG